MSDGTYKAVDCCYVALSMLLCETSWTFDGVDNREDFWPSLFTFLSIHQIQRQSTSVKSDDCCLFTDDFNKRCGEINRWIKQLFGKPVTITMRPAGVGRSTVNLPPNHHSQLAQKQSKQHVVTLTADDIKLGYWYLSTVGRLARMLRYS